MHAVFSLLPLVAAILAVPQLLPQLARLRRTGQTAGVSWSWAALTSVNNAAWPGIAAGTWLLIFGGLLCWGAFGIYESDPRLIVLGATGVTASLLVLAPVARPRGPDTLLPSGAGAVMTAEVRA